MGLNNTYFDFHSGKSMSGGEEKSSLVMVQIVIYSSIIICVLGILIYALSMYIDSQVSNFEGMSCAMGGCNYEGFEEANDIVSGGPATTPATSPVSGAPDKKPVVKPGSRLEQQTPEGAPEPSVEDIEEKPEETNGDGDDTVHTVMARQQSHMTKSYNKPACTIRYYN